MDPIRSAIEHLAQHGIQVTRTDDPWELYNAPGFPELTRNQVFSMATMPHLLGPLKQPPPRLRL